MNSDAGNYIKNEKFTAKNTCKTILQWFRQWICRTLSFATTTKMCRFLSVVVTSLPALHRCCSAGRQEEKAAPLALGKHNPSTFIMWSHTSRPGQHPPDQRNLDKVCQEGIETTAQKKIVCQPCTVYHHPLVLTEVLCFLYLYIRPAQIVTFAFKVNNEWIMILIEQSRIKVNILGLKWILSYCHYENKNL